MGSSGPMGKISRASPFNSGCSIVDSRCKYKTMAMIFHYACPHCGVHFCIEELRKQRCFLCKWPQVKPRPKEAPQHQII